MPAADLIRIAAVQMDPKLGQNAANLAEITARAHEAANGGAKLVVFPECALSGYVFDSRAAALAHAETVPGPATEALGSLCRERDIYLVLGMLEQAGGKLFNAAVLIGPGGVVGTYRKIHLPGMGVDRFVDPGDRPLTIHPVGGLRLGLHICYDASFPETGRVLTLMGADVLVILTNWPLASATTAEHLPPTRAIENVVYVVACNRVGEEAGFGFAGRSSICGPEGEVYARAEADHPAILSAPVDPARARQKRLVRVPGVAEIDRIADRRPEHYGIITLPRMEG